MQESIEENLSETASLTIRVLGDFAVCVDGKPLPRPRSRSEHWLLALLLLHHGRDVSREWLQETLWMDSTEAQAQANLRHALTNLRKALGAHAHRLESPSRRALHFNTEGSECDLVTFDAAIRRQDTASLETAVAAYGGVLLPNCSEAWVIPERENRCAAYLDALETLSERAAKRGENETARGYLRRVLETDEIRETACRELMQLLAQTGAYAEAFAVYRRFRHQLQATFANARDPVLPSPETVALYKQLRRQAKQQATATESAEQKTADAETVPSNLPSVLSAFIGRQQELRELGELIETEKLVTLVGTGGVGKTRLALETARSLEADFSNGVFLADLSALTDGELLTSHLAAIWGIREVTGEPLQETLRVWLRRRTLLLVLDNCEVIADACAVLMDFLLDHAPEVRVLATSRQPLRSAIERIYPLAPLTLPASASDLPLTDFQTAEAVQLFATRAKQARPDFALTFANADAVGKLCRRLDGLPLAIELAAARVSVLSVAQIAEMLGDRLRALPHPAHGVPARHRTLQAALDWSEDLLSAAERTLLHHLSIFAGSFGLQAAAAVLPASETVRENEATLIERLSRLAEKSLLVVQHGEPARYILLETLREYGREKLRNAGEETAVRHRMVIFLAAQVAAESTSLHSTQPDSMVRIELEQDNLRAALEWSLTDENLHEQALQMATALRPFWQARGQWSEGRRWLRSALQTIADEQQTPPRTPNAQRPTPNTYAAALHGAGTLALAQGDYDEARRCLEQALQAWQEIGDEAGEADTLTNLGATAFYRNDAAQAEAHLLACLNLRRKRNDAAGEAHALVWLGNLAMHRNALVDAQQFFEQALDLYERQGSALAVAQVQTNLAVIAHEQQEFALATALYRRVLERFRAAGYEAGVAMTLNNLGNVLRESGARREAKPLIEEAVRHWQDIQDDANLPLGHNTLGLTLCALEEYTAAHECFVTGAKSSLQRNDAANLVCSLYGLAWAAWGSEQAELSVRLLGTADQVQTTSDFVLSASDRRDQERIQSLMRDGMNKERFDAAYCAGKARSPRQLLLEAEMLLMESSHLS